MAEHEHGEESDRSSEEEEDPADNLLQRGRFLRELRELERQDEAERQAADEQESNDAPDVGHEEVTSLSTGDTVLCYESFLKHQRYYDDLKHVDHKYIDYGAFGTNSRLIIEQDKSLGKGGLCWDAAFILGEYLVNALTEGKSIATVRAIELGCGTGLCGLMVGKVVPSAHVALTDLPELMPLLNRNVNRNFHKQRIATSSRAEAEVTEYTRRRDNSSMDDVRGSVSASVLCWGDKQQEARHGTFDIVFGADVVATLYDPVALAETISHLSTSGTTVYVSFKERLSTVHRQFEEAMNERFDTISILRPSNCRNRNFGVQILVAQHKKGAL